MKIIQNLWFFCSVGLIFSIMVHNPKSQGMISAEETLDKITWFLIASFFTLTVYISTFSKFE